MQEFLMKDNEGIFYELKESNMKTAMQELIELIVNNKTRLDIIEKNQQMWLEKEKEQIINAFDMGRDETTRKFREDGEQYYNQTYNQNK
jgi:hypothetical protein